jgi:hypothetical protein
MNKTKMIILLILTSTIAYFAVSFNSKTKYESLVNCITGIAITLKLDDINIEQSENAESPLITGKTTLKQKKQLVRQMSDVCGIQSFEDFIEVQSEANDKIASINFKLDSVNNIATITGQVNSGFEHKRILSSFTDAVNQHYGPWEIQHKILISKNVKKNEFAIDITLVFSAISQVKLTDITVTNKKLTIKGLVRNNNIEKQTIKKLEQIFEGELNIINQLKPVIIEKSDIENIKFEDLIEVKPPPFFNNKK